MVEQLLEREQLPKEEEQQPEMVEEMNLIKDVGHPWTQRLQQRGHLHIKWQDRSK
jgi:hypothetical protein